MSAAMTPREAADDVEATWNLDANTTATRPLRVLVDHARDTVPAEHAAPDREALVRIREAAGLELSDPQSSSEARHAFGRVLDVATAALHPPPRTPGVPGPIRFTPRGFGIYAEGVDHDVQSYSVQESSLATERCLWVGAVKGRAHLTEAAAREVRDGITTWLGEAEPPATEDEDVHRFDLIDRDGVRWIRTGAGDTWLCPDWSVTVEVGVDHGPSRAGIEAEHGPLREVPHIPTPFERAVALVVDATEDGGQGPIGTGHAKAVVKALREAGLLVLPAEGDGPEVES